MQGVVIQFEGIWEKLDFMIWEKQGSRAGGLITKEPKWKLGWAESILFIYTMINYCKLSVC